ncbi:hypothetical protein BCR44DRAFT_1438159 [Catenaria anguillulae PL171]|uniref:Uncharacterized protein n=1 Tax=Catenaria anguillulae PL171 TaxID=765915 RepID=A0A1Y2HI28_9FUNG|nr:hypothetical protein BCR44DRAFT_1438159 [Catenaria anguillulae PL171]
MILNANSRTHTTPSHEYPPPRSALSSTSVDIGSWPLIPSHSRRQAIAIARRPPLVTPSGRQLIRSRTRSRLLPAARLP